MADSEQVRSNSSAAKPKLTLRERIAAIAVDVAAPLLWVYAIVKVFVFDVDLYVIRRIAPRFEWLVEYKVFIFLAIVACALLLGKRSKLLLSSLFIGFYPLIVCGYLIYLIFRQKSWNLGIAFVNSVIVFMRSLRYNLLVFSLFAICACLVMVSKSRPILWSSAAAIVALLFSVYFRSLFFVLRPSGAFEVYGRLSHWIRQKMVVPLGSIDADMRSLTIQQFNEAQLNKWKANLQMVVLSNRVFLFTARKLKEYQASGLNIVSYVFTVFLLFLFTICSFALANWGLFRIDAGEFAFSTQPSFFLFVYYSFNCLFYRAIAEVSPARPMSQTCLMLELVCAMFLVVILVTLLFTVKNQRYSRELDEAISEIRTEGNAIEALIKDEYRVDGVDAAIRELERLQFSVMGIIYSMSKYL